MSTTTNVHAWGETVADFLKAHPKGGARAPGMQYVVESLRDGKPSPASSSALRRIVSLALDGDGDVHWALREALDAHLVATGDTPAEREAFELLLREAIIVVQGDAESGHDLRSERVRAATDELLIRREATRLADELEADTADQIALVTIEELLGRPAPVWLVEDFLQRDTLTLIAGAPGVGKSFLAIDLAMSVATGLPFLGDVDTVRGRVLYCAGEGIGGIPERLRSWMKWHGTSAPETFMMSESGVNLSNEGSVQRLEALMVEHEIDLVIFDTFRKLSSVTDENQPGEVGLALRNAERIRKARAGASSVVIHHSNKSDGINGSRAFESEPENVYLLRGSNTAFDVHAIKTKDAAGLGFTSLSLKTVGNSAVVIRTGAEPTIDLIAMLEVGREYTTADLHELLEPLGASATRERAIKNCVASGRLEKVRKGVYQRPSIHHGP